MGLSNYSNVVRHIPSENSFKSGTDMVEEPHTRPCKPKVPRLVRQPAAAAAASSAGVPSNAGQLPRGSWQGRGSLEANGGTLNFLASIFGRHEKVDLFIRGWLDNGFFWTAYFADNSFLV